ncbi:MAG: LuxR C-terminal-related transcriptional regulator [Phycisphaeraceae bacterium]
MHRYYPPLCIITDLRLPDANALDLQRQMRRQGINAPLIILSEKSEVGSAVRAMKNSAFDFLSRPVDGAWLLQRIGQAVELDDCPRRHDQALEQVRQRVDRLTPRERQILHRVVAGTSNKNTAAALGLTKKTVENYRAHLMLKMEAVSLAHLVRMAMVAGLVTVPGICGVTHSCHLCGPSPHACLPTCQSPGNDPLPFPARPATALAI